MSRYSENHQFPIDKKNPIIEYYSHLPGEQWKLITEEMIPEVLPYYAISNYGRVLHVYTKSFMSESWDNSGYTIVVLRTRSKTVTCRVHRLVMMAFRPDHQENHSIVHHINNDKHCNVLDFPIYNEEKGIYEPTDNLEWTDQSSNEHYAYVDGVKKYCPPKGTAKMSNEKVIEICEYLSLGKFSNREIANLCGVSLGDVENIKYRRSWQHISADYEFKTKNPPIITDDIIRSICKDLELGRKMTDIAIARRVKLDFVKGIKYRRIKTEISKDYNF